ncbi:glycosyltransferase family 2 protein [Rubinisphaera italica]|uniref:Poly-beta-1,6-N-acetyl-D-glucosamine synthase n=1 Tax=Rubinisphaera italica TaxID=2527969 RepID=A0A5C5XFM2_9PLAN|nr:glycosyltransferase family 2 protein [Rubinisphaera italica]TWT61558.1 Poly-beta-1,6-N-acetyl-D-glucosamine synthase [Rubinisphaera italica]
MTPLEMTFLVCLFVIGYAYLGFPLLTFLRSLVVRKTFQCEEITPAVSLIICCYNEEAGIEEKMKNVLELDYPAEKLQVLVASDGSTDRTNEIVAGYQNNQIKLLKLPRAGKARSLNAAVHQANGDILVFSDANSMYAADSIRELVKPFADLSIGGVAGNQVYSKNYDDGAAASGEQSYWNFDRWMKIWQSRSGHVISATGAIYAIRRFLFQPVPEGVTDDFVTSTRVIAQGYRLIFNPQAICREPAAGAVKAELGRKTRVTTRGLRAVWCMRTLLNPFKYGFYSFQLFSHKLLRRLVVLPILALGIITPLLWNQGWIYQAATILEILFIGLAVAGCVASMTRRKPPRLMSLPFYFCMINVAVLMAIMNLLRGHQVTLWNPHRGGLTTPTS